jgi:hypothetical protein
MRVSADELNRFTVRPTHARRQKRQAPCSRLFFHWLPVLNSDILGRPDVSQRHQEDRRRDRLAGRRTSLCTSSSAATAVRSAKNVKRHFARQLFLPAMPRRPDASRCCLWGNSCTSRSSQMDTVSMMPTTQPLDAGLHHLGCPERLAHNARIRNKSAVP